MLSFKQHPLASSDVVFLSRREGGVRQFICEHCLFWTAYGTSCKTLEDANSGESDFK